VWRLILALVLGAIMPIEGTEGLSLTLTNKVGNRAISELGAVWTPWPNDLWTIVKGAPYECPRVDTWSDHHFYYPYPVAIDGGHRSEIEYTTDGNEAFNLTDDSVCFRWRPPVNDGDADYYASFGLSDGSTDILVEILAVEEGGDPELSVNYPLPSVQPSGAAVWKSAAWTPDGDYLAVTGDEEILFYSWDGTTLTHEATYDAAQGDLDSFGAIMLSWDPTSTYLAVGGVAAFTSGHPSCVAWFKRTGAALSLLPMPTAVHPDDPTDGEPDVYGLEWSPDGVYLAVGTVKRYRNALSIFKRTGDTALDLIFPDPALPEDDPQVYGGWFGWADDPVSDVYGLAWDPDGDFLAVAHWGGDADDHYLNMYAWNSSTEELSQVSGGAPTLPAGSYIYPYELRFDPTGTYLAYASDGYAADVPPDPDYSMIRMYKHDGNGFLTDLEIQYDPLGIATVWGQPGWDPTGTYLAFGYQERTGPFGARVYTSKIGWMQRTGDTFTPLTALDLTGQTGFTWTSATDPYSVVWHPTDPILAVVAGAADNAEVPKVFLVDVAGLSGGGAGDIALKITVDANDPVIVSPYSTTTHRWLRISHTSSGDVIVVDTAGTDCSGWTQRASLPLASGNVVNALAITVNAWSDHNEADAGAPDPGYYGPFGPLGEELYLTLTNAVQTIYQEGEDGLIFTLTNEVGDY